MRNIVCSEDKICKLEPMKGSTQSGSGIDEDYLIPVKSVKEKPVKKRNPRKKIIQTGKGKKKTNRKPSKKVSKPKASKKARRKTSGKRKQTKKKVPWTV